MCYSRERSGPGAPVPTRYFGSFPKISTTVENTVENIVGNSEMFVFARFLDHSVGAEPGNPNHTRRYCGARWPIV